MTGTRSSTADPLVRAGVVTGLASSVLLPLFAWWAPGGGLAAIVAAFLAFTAAGPGIAALAVGRSRALWAATAPATSLATVMLASLAQILLDAWSPPVTATIVGMVGAAASVTWLRGSPRVEERREPRIDPVAVAVFAALAVALGLWFWATRAIDLDAAGATGLIGVLPWQWFAALAVIVATFAALIALGRSRPVRHGLLFATGVAAAILVTLTVNVADGGGVFGTGYVHVGFAEAINDRGTVLLGFDARFSWPAFFTAIAAIGAWAGLPDTSVFVIYHPAVLMSCYLPVIAVIGRALTGSARVGWLGALLFIFANWGQQDYFSPQSTALLLYLSVTAVILHEIAETWRWSAPVPEGSATRPARIVVKRNALRRGTASFRRMVQRTPAAPPGWTGRTVLGVEALLLLLATALVTQHQLTPVALILALFAWALLGRTRHRSLWFAVGLVFTAWFAFGAYDWWTGHLGILLEGLGQPNQALASGLADRVRGDATYQAMQWFRIGWSAVLAVGGFIGWLLLRGRFPLAAAAVPVIAPASLVLGQSYGGEMVLRVFLYASPFLAVLTAHALIRGLTRLPGTRAGAVALAVVLALAGTMGITARGVNVAFERTPADMLTAARELLDIAPYGTTVRPLALEGALRVGRVGEIHHPSTVVNPEQDEVVNLIQQSPDYVFLTSTREAYERILNGASDDYYNDVARRLEGSGVYRIVLRTDHVIMLERIAEDGRPLSENPGVRATDPRGDGTEDETAGDDAAADNTGDAETSAPETEGNER